MNLKKPTTFSKQVDLLEGKNISVSDKDDCESFLGRVNYYRFSAYFLPFRNSNGVANLPIEFIRLKKIYEFDCELRSLIFSAIEDIEIHVRTQLAYFHSHKYGSEGYLSASNFNKRHVHKQFLNHVQSCINENRNTPIVKHHTTKYGGHFPLWTIIDFFSVGMLSYFFRGMINHDKATIASNLYNGTNYQTLDSWLRCLTDLRNRCAHYSRIYYWKFPAVPRMPNNINITTSHGLFSQIYMLKLMYPDKEQWEQKFLKPLTKLIKKYRPYINLAHMDFPRIWKSMLKNK